MMDRNTLFELIPAYALGALDADERAEVEALLATDAEAQRLLAEYQSLTEALILATPARRAPGHLNDDLRHRLAFSRSQANGAAVPSPQKQESELKVVPSRRPRIWIPIAAAAAIIVILAGAVLFIRNQQPPDPAQLYSQIAALPGALQIPLTPIQQSTTKGYMVATADGKQAVVMVSDLPTIASNQTFELWLVDPSGAHAAGLLSFPTSAGPNYIAVPLDKPVKDYTLVGLSIEPSGGSPDPTAPSGPMAFGVTISP